MNAYLYYNICHLPTHSLNPLVHHASLWSLSLSRSEHLNCARLLPDCLAASKTQSLAEQGVVSEFGFDGHKPDKPAGQQADKATKEDEKGAAGGGEGRKAKKGEGDKPAKGKRPTADPTTKDAPKGKSGGGGGGGKTSKGEGFVL